MGTFFQRHICEVRRCDVGRDCRACSLCSQCIPKVFYRVEIRTLCWPLKGLPHQTPSSVSLWTELCAGVQSCWNRKGPSPNCSHNIGSMKLFKIPWYAQALKVAFPGSKRSSPTSERQPPTSKFSLATKQSEIYHPNI